MKLPKFIKFKENNKRILSIDFGGSFIKVVYLEVRRDKYVLLAYALKEFNSNLKTSEELSAELKEILQANSIAVKETYLSIADPDRIFIKKLTLPQMSKDELLKAAQWQLKSDLPFSAEESVSDLQIIREYADSEGAKKIELFCVFAKKELINKYLSVVTACGLSPFKISISAFNYCATLGSLATNPKISAIFDIGRTYSCITIYQNNKLNFLRNLNFSTSKLSSSLAGTLVTDRGRIEIGFDKAEALMQQFGIPLDESVELQDDIKADQIITLMRPLLETVVKELERSFDYFKSESAIESPEILYITGGGANLKNLDSYLAGQLKIKVVKLPLADSLDVKNMDLEKLSLNTNQLSSALSLGLFAPGINLLPREIKSQKSELIQKNTLHIAAIIISVIFIFSWAVINFQIHDYKSRLKIAKLHLQSVEEVKALKQIVELREDLINKINTGKVPSGGLLKLIGAIIPPNIMLEEFNFDQSSHLMHLSGTVSASKESVEKVLTDFINRLENSKFILDANLVSSVEGQGVNNFEIECHLAK